MAAASPDKREHLYKILVIGELGTGKTSFIKRYVHQFFSQNYRATIGVDFALKVLNWDQNTIIRLQLWDIAGKFKTYTTKKSGTKKNKEKNTLWKRGLTCSTGSCRVNSCYGLKLL